MDENLNHMDLNTLKATIGEKLQTIKSALSTSTHLFYVDNQNNNNNNNNKYNDNNNYLNTNKNVNVNARGKYLHTTNENNNNNNYLLFLKDIYNKNINNNIDNNNINNNNNNNYDNNNNILDIYNSNGEIRDPNKNDGIGNSLYDIYLNSKDLNVDDLNAFNSNNNNNPNQPNVQFRDFNQNTNDTILVVFSGVLLSALLILTLFLIIMVYCCLKRRNSYKSTPNDLASLTLNSSSLDASLISNIQQQLHGTLNVSDNHLNVIDHHSSSTTSTATSTISATTSDDINNNTNSNHHHHNHNHHHLYIGLSHSISNISTNCGSSSSSLVNMKTPLKEICISIPVAKPSLNESKPQLSIDTKMKAKTLFESKSLFNKRRGSNNSLTLTISPVKKKLSISSPSKECSTLEYLSKASRILSIHELIDISKDNNNLYNEFYLIPFNHAELSVHGSSIKNRYKTIIPNESTRVKLPVRNNDPLSSYINANYISGYKSEARAYIASQGPMSNTIVDFWNMIWNECVSSVVMITKLIERNKSKCELYIPEQCMQPVVYDSLVVVVNQINYFQDYEVRQLTIKNQNETRNIYHYWYTAWPDHTVPENPNALIQLIKQVESLKTYDENIPKGPILVHCSAGVGRSGCFLALSMGIKQIDAENLVDIVQIVCSLRKDRGGMIQTLEQYEFVYQVLAYYCIYYKNHHHHIPHHHHHHHFNFISTSSCSPSVSVSSPSSSCIQPSETSSFTFGSQTIQ